MYCILTEVNANLINEPQKNNANLSFIEGMCCFHVLSKLSCLSSILELYDMHVWYLNS